LPPPESLCKKVFPQLEESVQFLNSIPLGERDRAAGSVLNTLEWFRTVILEDAVALRTQAQFRDSPLFAHMLFRDPEFLNYERSALLASREDQIPTAIQIQQLVPDIARELNTVTQVMSGQLTFVSKNIDQIQKQIIVIIDNQKSQDQRYMALERFADRMNRGQIRVVSHLQADFEGSGTGPIDNMNPSGPTYQSLILSSTLADPPSSGSYGGPHSHRSQPATENASMNHHPSSSESVQASQAIPEYLVNTLVPTVDLAWEEYEKGLVNGPDGMRSPSIQYLEDKFHAKWRKGDKARQRYTRRMALINRIKKAAKGLKLPESDVAHRIELWRKAKGMTLDKIQKTLQSCKDMLEPWGQGDRQLLHIH